MRRFSDQKSQLNTQNTARFPRYSSGTSWAESRFLLSGAFLRRQRKELLAFRAGPEFEVGNALWIYFCGEEKLDRIVSQNRAIGELDHGQTIIEDLKRRFLSLAFCNMAEHENRLALAFGPEVFQQALSCSGACKPFSLTTGIGSDDRHGSGHCQNKEIEAHGI